MQVRAGFVGVGILALAIAGPALAAETTLKERVESRLTRGGLAATSTASVPGASGAPCPLRRRPARWRSRGTRRGSPVAPS